MLQRSRAIDMLASQGRKGRSPPPKGGKTASGAAALRTRRNLPLPPATAKSNSANGESPEATDWPALIAQDWQLLADAPPDVRADPNVVCEAVRESNGQALRFASEELRADREFLLGAAQEMGPVVLECASENLRTDRDFIMEVADYCNPSDVLWYVADDIREELLADRVFVLEAVKQVGSEVLEQAALDLRSDKAFILEAAEHCVSKGEAVQYASEELRREFFADSDFMLQAIAEAGAGVLEDASPELLADRTFVLAAASSASLGEVLPYVPEWLRSELTEPDSKPQPPAPLPVFTKQVAMRRAQQFEEAPPLKSTPPSKANPPLKSSPPSKPSPPLKTSPPLKGPPMKAPPRQVPEPAKLQAVLPLPVPSFTMPFPTLPELLPVEPVQVPTVAVLTEKKIGVQVRRGPDWVWENQDGGDGQVGTTEPHSMEGWVQVRWASGECGVYRVGLQARYDLLEILAPTPMSVPPVAPEPPAQRPVPPWRRQAKAPAEAVPAEAPASAAPVASEIPNGVLPAANELPSDVAAVAASEPLVELRAGQISGEADPRKRSAQAPPWQRNRRSKRVCVETVGGPATVVLEPASDEPVMEESAVTSLEESTEPTAPISPDTPAVDAPADDGIATPVLEVLPSAGEPRQPQREEEEEEERSAAEEALQAVRELGADALEAAPAELRADREFMLAASRLCPLADVLRFLPDQLHTELLADRNFVLRAVEEIGVAVLAYASKQLLGDLGFMMEAAACSSPAEAMKYATEELREELEGSDEEDAT